MVELSYLYLEHDNTRLSDHNFRNVYAYNWFARNDSWFRSTWFGLFNTRPTYLLVLLCCLFTQGAFLLFFFARRAYFLVLFLLLKLRRLQHVPILGFHLFIENRNVSKDLYHPSFDCEYDKNLLKANYTQEKVTSIRLMRLWWMWSMSILICNLWGRW